MKDMSSKLSNFNSDTIDTKRFFTSLSPMALRVSLLLAIVISSPAALGGTYIEKTLHSFTGGVGDGANPFAHLTYVNAHGSEMLFGTTYCGDCDKGTVFSLDPSKTDEETVHQFTGVKGDGALPYAGLIEYRGMLYGTTLNGGMSGQGTIFSIDPWSGKAKTLYSFTGTHGDGALPNAGLVESEGVLYGTTSNGGTHNVGTMFSISLKNAEEKTLCSFTGVKGDGALPYAGMIAYNGILYGTTYAGGTQNKGTIFEINPATCHHQILYSFTGVNGDGALPYASLIEYHGSLYGTTLNGGTTDQGTVFGIDPVTHHETTLHSFTSASGDGASPNASLVEYNRVLVGTTYYGGKHNKGTVFEIDPANGNTKTLYPFSGAGGDGASPNASLTVLHGKLYGTTYYGGTANKGTVYKLDGTQIGPLPYASVAALAPLGAIGTGGETNTGGATSTGTNTGTGTGTGTSTGTSTGIGTGTSTGIGTGTSTGSTTGGNTSTSDSTGTGTGTNTGGDTGTSDSTGIGTGTGTSTGGDIGTSDTTGTGTGFGTNNGVIHIGPHPTPEPSSWAAFGIGGAGLFILSFRTRRANRRRRTHD